ncbi:hypothetical protein GDO78_023253 [Eleutherodactylus coqui]|uniref:Uncharacterized protein n=1 Tax=Eleutherodactylus coqui TaxID=57060 RepID=A0A8J6BHI4_ELECQ|nr:hypothetical protein GDO78_023253 [Eleutherodactylus coqui]
MFSSGINHKVHKMTPFIYSDHRFLGAQQVGTWSSSFSSIFIPQNNRSNTRWRLWAGLNPSAMSSSLVVAILGLAPSSFSSCMSRGSEGAVSTPVTMLPAHSALVSSKGAVLGPTLLYV